MPNAHYEKLEVWQRSIEMVEAVYRVTRGFPADEKAGLAATLRRTAGTIPAKIADADGHDDPAKTRQPLSAARGSIREMQSYLYLCRRMRFVGYFAYSSLRRKLHRIDRKLSVQELLLTPESAASKAPKPARRATRLAA